MRLRQIKKELKKELKKKNEKEIENKKVQIEKGNKSPNRNWKK